MELQPEIYLHLAIAFLAASLFYLVIPGAGAFYVRSTWRRFRRTLLKAVRFPLVDYGTIHGNEEGFAGCHRFFGRLQAFAGDEAVWLSDGKTSLRVHLEHTPVYILSSMPSPALQEGRYRFPEESPRRVAWSSIGPLPEYTQFFVAGGLYRETSGAYLTDTADCPLTVIIYEGQARDLIPGAIWSGRQRNEYWNLFTPWSLAFGSLLLFIHFYLIVRYPALHLPAVFTATLALFPLISLAPPGLFFYYLYRSLWRRGRQLRAVRDLLRIPTSLCASDEMGESERPGCTLAYGERYVLERFHLLPGSSEMGPEVWRLDVPEMQSEEHDGYYVFAAEREQGEQLRSPQDPAARAMLIPGNPYLLAERCEKRAIRSELLAVLLFLAGTLLNGFILFVALMYILR